MVFTDLCALDEIASALEGFKSEMYGNASSRALRLDSDRVASSMK